MMLLTMTGLWQHLDIFFKNSTLKILKIGIPEIITVNVPKMEKLMHVTSKRSRQNGKQCTAWSDCYFWGSMIWVCAVCLDLVVPILRTFRVHITSKDIQIPLNLFLTVSSHSFQAQSPSQNLTLASFKANCELKKLIRFHRCCLHMFMVLGNTTNRSVSQIPFNSGKLEPFSIVKDTLYLIKVHYICHIWHGMTNNSICIWLEKNPTVFLLNLKFRLLIKNC